MSIYDTELLGATGTQNQLLGWPHKLPGEDLYPFAFSPTAPNPYAPGESVNVPIGYIATYYNDDGTVRWTADTRDLSNTGYFIAKGNDLPRIFFGDNGFIYALVKHATLTKSYVVKFDVATGVMTQSANYIDVFEDFVKFTWADGTLIVLGEGDDFSATAIDMDTLATVSLNVGHYSVTQPLQTGSYPYAGIALFNGAVVLARTELIDAGYRGHDAVNAVFGLNTSLDFTAISGKTRVETQHCYATDMFVGDVYHLSKDLFMCGEFARVQYSDIYPRYRPKLITREKLEAWAADAIYKTTGIQLEAGE